MVLAIAVPIMIQNGITNFVNMLDNIMIGQVGTEPMSGVAIVNQLIFVYNLCLFGGVSGAGIFTAQYFGQKNDEGVRQTVRFKLWIVTIITLLTTTLFLTAGPSLIRLYLQGEGTAESVAATLHYGRQYLLIMLLGLLPFMMVQVYSSTLRECGQTILPMKAGIVAVFVNLILNYILIYGKLGAPALGVQGAAIATVISRYTEAAIVLIHTHRHKEQNPFAAGLYRTLKVPANLAKKIIVKGMPLLLNEALWAAGVAMVAQCYSVRGLSVVAAQNISSTISNLFNTVYLQLGGCISIVVGQLLGAGKTKEARDADNKMIFFSVFSCACISILMILVGRFFPSIYNTEENIKELARSFIVIAALAMPLCSFSHCAYFTLRSGGKTIVTFLFDSVYTWVLIIPFAYTLTNHTALSINMVFFLVQFTEIIKVILGFFMVKSDGWMQNIVEDS